MVVWVEPIGFVFIKKKTNFKFDSFAGKPDKFLLNQLPKPIKYQKKRNSGYKFKIKLLILLIFFLFNRKNKLSRCFLKNVFSIFVFAILNMPINVFGNSPKNSGKKLF